MSVLRSGIAGFVLALALVAVSPVLGQTDPPAPDAAEVRALIETLEDDAARERLLGQLRLLIEAAEGAGSAPDLGTAVLGGFSKRIAGLSAGFADLFAKGGGVARVGRWLGEQFETPERRDLWVEVIWKLAVVVAAGLIARALAVAALRRPRRRLEERDVSTFWVRLPLLAARTVLDLLPIGFFAGFAYLALAAVQPGATVRVVALAAISAAVIAWAAGAAARLTFTPLAPSLRLIALDDRTAAYLYVWFRRLVRVAVYGYFFVEAALALGLPAAGGAALLKLIGIVFAAMVLLVVFQSRAAVAQWIRGAADQEGGGRGLRVLRERIADVWHILAALYLIAVAIVWVLDVAGGFAFVARASALSLVAVVVARVALAVVRGAMGRVFRISAEIRARFPYIEARTDRYVAGTGRVLEWVVYVLAALAVVQAWGIDVFAFLGGETGRDLLGRAFQVVAIVVVALIVWEGASGLIARYLSGAESPEGERVERSARARTLLPLARNALLVVIVIVASLTVLSALGLDIAPLLAGAGVVGLAVGFGAQTLVKDVITGAFLLFEDTVQVGDVAVIDGQGGLVEAITIRTIRLRDLSGSVHTIPFSTVGAITNMTKEYSCYVLDVGVAYREDTDQVADLLREIDAELRADDEFSGDILKPIEILGVDRFEDSAVVVRARLTTKPIMQWTVGREFNRRLKKKFDEHGIEIPFPHQTIYFGEDKHGRAPVAHIRVDKDGAKDP